MAKNKRDNLDSQVQERDPKTTVQMLNFLGFWGAKPPLPPGRDPYTPSDAWAAPGPLPNFGTPPPLPDLVRPCSPLGWGLADLNQHHSLAEVVPNYLGAFYGTRSASEWTGKFYYPLPAQEKKF